jgi:RNA polymerase sigma factor (sigma-70 family)
VIPERSRSVTEYFRGLTTSAEDTPDQELVGDFVACRSEAAFTALVKRHGPMVLSLCRRVLGNHQDAEDAFQATFLVLARKAPRLRDPRLVGSWLYGVAARTAAKARTARVRQEVRERAAATPISRDPLAELTVREAQGIIDEELARLPQKFRSPLILCCLEGLARDEAARRLGWTAGLLKSRLEQARELLRGRLARRGIPLPAAFLTVGLLGTAANAALPEPLATSTIHAGARVAAGGSAAGIATPAALALTNGVMRTMFLAKIKMAVVLSLALLTAGALAAAPLLTHKAPAPVPSGQAQRPKPPVVADKADKTPPLTAEALERWGKAEAVCLAKLVAARPGPVARSEPPIYSHTLELTILNPLRGTLKKGTDLSAHHAARQQNVPTFPVGKDCLVALKQSQGRWQVVTIREATAEDIAEAKLACSVPLGWSVVKGRLVSPWASLGGKAWPANARIKGWWACAETGRPSLSAGDGIELTVEVVPPKKSIKWTNPDGDGDYRVTVKNTTEKPLPVPALLRAGDKVLWDESLVILCQGKTYPVPGARGVKEAPRPVVLKPGEAVSTVVNALKLQGPQWPRGGYRIEFQFALGDKSITKSFYYLSRHHDVVRQQLLGGKPEKKQK